MNNQKKLALRAVLASALFLSLGMAVPAEAAQTVWVLAGEAAGSDGVPQVVSAGAGDTASGVKDGGDVSQTPQASAKAGPLPQPAGKETVSAPVPQAARGAGADESVAGENAAAKVASGETQKQSKGKSDAKGKNAASDTSISKEHPLIVKADAMQYNSKTGDVDISGQVDMRHLTDVYETEHVYGNSKTQQYTIPVPVRWTAPGNVMDADNGTYDAKTGMSEFGHIKGWNQGKYYYEGESGTFDRNANKGVVQKGYFTTKHAVAKVPDYRIEADSIDIYPNDHYTAHNVSLFIKNTRLITMKTYNGSLKQDNGASLWTLIPRPSYDSDNGFGLQNSIKFPLGGVSSEFYFYSRLGWYTNAGFKPDVGFQWNTVPGTFKLRYAKEESSLNDDHVWVEMRPSLSFDSNHYYIPGTNFYLGARGEMGNWKEGSVSGSHKLWNVYLGHDPITLGSHLSFNWGIGYLKDYYGYNDAVRRNQYYSVGLSGNYGRFSSWVSYTNNDEKGKTPYSFDTYDMTKPLVAGGRIQLTPLDAIGVSYSIDTVNGRLEHRDYTYYRDLHSFYGWVRYRDIDGDFEVMIQPKDFSF